MKHQKALLVVGLGPGDPAALTLGAQSAMEEADTLVLRTGKHEVAAWLVGRRIPFYTLDSLYATCDDFDELCERTVRSLLETLDCCHTLCYAVIDPAQDATIEKLLAALPPEVAVRILPCVPMSAQVHAATLLADRSFGPYRTSTATDLPRLQHDPDLPLCVTELNSRILASQVKLWLMERYPPQCEISFFEPNDQGPADAKRIALEDLDRQPAYDHTAAIWVPALDLLRRERFGFADLVRIMRMLRAPDGCPWDREQTHQSLRQHLIEEAYEAVDAVDGQDPDALADELGDVLLQVVFHAQIGQEHGTFTADDVTTAICRKLISRHAHIFGQVHCETADDVQRSWDAIKQQERGQTTHTETLQSVPKYLPALLRAAKVQKKAANACGRPSAQDALGHARSLIETLRAGGDPLEQGGDLLFAVVAALCALDVQPELALSAAIERFVAGFSRTEAQALRGNLRLADLPQASKDALWAHASSDKTP